MQRAALHVQSLQRERERGGVELLAATVQVI